MNYLALTQDMTLQEIRAQNGFDKFLTHVGSELVHYSIDWLQSHLPKILLHINTIYKLLPKSSRIEPEKQLALFLNGYMAAACEVQVEGMEASLVLPSTQTDDIKSDDQRHEKKVSLSMKIRDIFTPLVQKSFELNNATSKLGASLEIRKQNAIPELFFSPGTAGDKLHNIMTLIERSTELKDAYIWRVFSYVRYPSIVESLSEDISQTIKKPLQKIMMWFVLRDMSGYDRFSFSSFGLFIENTSQQYFSDHLAVMKELGLRSVFTLDGFLETLQYLDEQDKKYSESDNKYLLQKSQQRSIKRTQFIQEMVPIILEKISAAYQLKQLVDCIEKALSKEEAQQLKSSLVGILQTQPYFNDNFVSSAKELYQLLMPFSVADQVQLFTYFNSRLLDFSRNELGDFSAILRLLFKDNMMTSSQYALLISTLQGSARSVALNIIHKCILNQCAVEDYYLKYIRTELTPEAIPTKLPLGVKVAYVRHEYRKETTATKLIGGEHALYFVDNNIGLCYRIPFTRSQIDQFDNVECVDGRLTIESVTKLADLMHKNNVRFYCHAWAHETSIPHPTKISVDAMVQKITTDLGTTNTLNHSVKLQKLKEALVILRDLPKQQNSASVIENVRERLLDVYVSLYNENQHAAPETEQGKQTILMLQFFNAMLNHFKPEEIKISTTLSQSTQDKLNKQKKKNQLAKIEQESKRVHTHTATTTISEPLSLEEKIESLVIKNRTIQSSNFQSDTQVPDFVGCEQHGNNECHVEHRAPSPEHSTCAVSENSYCDQDDVPLIRSKSRQISPFAFGCACASVATIFAALLLDWKKPQTKTTLFAAGIFGGSYIFSQYYAQVKTQSNPVMAVEITPKNIYRKSCTIHL